MTGVYVITCRRSGRRYVGQAMGAGGMASRFEQHCRALAAGRHFNVYLQRAWDRYGQANFAFRCVAECRSQRQADRLEKAAIRRYKTTNKRHGFNFSPGGKTGGSMSHPETYARFCAAIARPEVRAKISASNKGRKATKAQLALRWTAKKRREAAERMRVLWRKTSFRLAHSESCNSLDYRNRASLLRKQEWRRRLNK